MSKEFTKKANKIEPGFSVAIFLGNGNKKQKTGKVGLEIEIEGANLPHEGQTPPPWVYHADGSLRGQDNGEYVLNAPVEFDAVAGALDTLWGKFKELKSKFDDSNRTSVHVHLNCQEFHLNRLTSFMALYFTFEEILTQWCGEHRVGNLFCLRAKDAPAIITQVKRFIRTDGRAQLQDHLHYSGLNTNALHKFGSLEVRSLRGVHDPKVILDWVSILRRLYDLSGDYEDPRDICAGYSGEGALVFFDSILGPVGPMIRTEIKWTDDRIRDSLHEGIRLAQDICYCRDWTLFKAMNMKPDPFNRDPRKIMKKMMNADQQMVAEGLMAIEEDEMDFDEFAAQPHIIFNQTPLEQAVAMMENAVNQTQPVTAPAPPTQWADAVQPFLTNPFQAPEDNLP